MSTENTWPLPWRIAVALARNGLPKNVDRWSDWADGLTAEQGVCDRCGAAIFYRSFLCTAPGVDMGMCRGRWTPVPVPDPSDAEAYRADCARRGVEPGPMPALSWTGPDGFGWRVCEGGVSFFDGKPDDDVIAWFNGTSVRFYADSIEHPLDVIARIVAICTAAARAMGGVR